MEEEEASVVGREGLGKLKRLNWPPVFWCIGSSEVEESSLLCWRCKLMAASWLR